MAQQMLESDVLFNKTDLEILMQTPQETDWTGAKERPALQHTSYLKPHIVKIQSHACSYIRPATTKLGNNRSLPDISKLVPGPEPPLAKAVFCLTSLHCRHA